MKKIILFLAVFSLISQPTFALDINSFFKFNSEEKKVERLLKSQVHYANKLKYDKFISTYDQEYVNSDGFNLETFSALIKDIWNSYKDIEYSIEIKDIDVKNDIATVRLTENAYAEIPMNDYYDGELKSISDTIYTLKKRNGKWKVISDSIIEEMTEMMYGEAKNIDVKLTAPLKISANTDYTATLEFIPPENTIAIASIAVDKVEYPQKQTKEVFRALPEDNILERIFTSNNDKVNEYVVASIGLTKTSVCDLSVKLSLTGFGYAIKRVNVIQEKEKEL